jgi:GNAT superfamily N-acetyltransferase
MTSEYTISTDKTKLDIPLIHQYLSQQSYWAQNIPLDIVERSIENSICFGVYHHDKQVGFARVVTDQATFGYLADVFILPEHRGLGLSKQLVAFIMAYPSLQGLRRFMLDTRDAHTLYAQFGFSAPDKPDNIMQCRPIENY